MQYCQKNGHLKRYFPSYAKLRIIILIFLQKWEERVTESNKRLRLWILLTGEPIQFMISADWIIEHDLCQILCVVLELLNFLWNREGWNSFWQPNVLSILGKITICPKSVRTNKKGQSWFVQSQQNDYQFWIAQCQKNEQFENPYITSHEEARSIKFKQQGKPQRVGSIGYPVSEWTMSLPIFTWLWQISISSLRGYCYQIWAVTTTPW